MPTRTLIDLNRDLQQSDIDPRVKHFLAEIFENTVALEQEFDKITSVMLSFADTIQGFVQLNEQTQKQLQCVINRNKIDGVDVRSETVTDKPGE